MRRWKRWPGHDGQEGVTQHVRDAGMLVGGGSVGAPRAVHAAPRPGRGMREHPQLWGGRSRATEATASRTATQAALPLAQERPAPSHGPGRPMGRCPQARRTTLATSPLGPRCAIPPCTLPRRPGEGDQKRVRSAQQGRGPMCGGPEHRGTRASTARARAAGRCGARALRYAGARVASRRAHLRLHLRPDLHGDLAAHARQRQLRRLASVLGALERVEQRLSVLGIAKHLRRRRWRE